MNTLLKQKNAAFNKLKAAFYNFWLGQRDSNPRMLGPKPSALPLGDAQIQ